jgi:hypothetical protein
MTTLGILWLYSRHKRTKVQNKTLRETIPGYFRIGGEPGENEIAEGAFFCATFAPVFVDFFLHCFEQFSG